MLLLRNNYDCLVIGGGPAGTTLAMTLAGWGRRVAIVEEGRRPTLSEHEDLEADARPLVKRLGLSVSLVHVASHCPRRRLVLWGDGEVSESRLEREDFAMRVDRARFDADLRNLARGLGVDVFEPARIEEPLPPAGHGQITITTPDGQRRIQVETIVLATGRRLDSRLLPLAVEHSGPEAVALTAPARALGDRSRLDALESLPFGFLRWQSAALPGGWGRVTVVVDRERDADDPDDVIAEALMGSGIGFGEVELDEARRVEATPRVVTTRAPIFLTGSAAVALDPLLGTSLAAALADGEAAAVAVNTVIERPRARAAVHLHEKRRQETRHREELARALGLYLREARFSDLPFWSRRHGAVHVEIESAEPPIVPERLRVAVRVGRYEIWERRGDLLEAIVGWGLPGGPVRQSVHRVLIEPLIALVEKVEWTDDIVTLAGQDPRLCVHSRQNLLQALGELCRLGILEPEPVPD